MSLQNIYVGDYGQPVEATILDVDTNAAQDISGYTTLQMIFTKADGTPLTKTAGFKTDGTDGIISYTVEAGVLSVVGIWDIRGRVQSGSAQLTTEKEKFYVGA